MSQTSAATCLLNLDAATGLLGAVQATPIMTREERDLIDEAHRLLCRIRFRMKSLLQPHPTTTVERQAVSGVSDIVYVAGPMTGLPDHNYPAFAAAQSRLEAEGYRVRSPHRIGKHECWAWEDYMRRAIAIMIRCDQVYMLQGWETSRGARLEYQIATALGMPILYELGAATRLPEGVSTP